MLLCPPCRDERLEESISRRYVIFAQTVTPRRLSPPPSLLNLIFLLQDTGNKVARKATLVGTQNIMLGGKTVIMQDAMIRGDLARTAVSSSGSGAAPAPASNTAVAIGRYCFLSKGCCLRPPGRMYKG